MASRPPVVAYSPYVAALPAQPVKKSLDEKKLGMIMVAPALLMMMVVAVYPVLNAIWMSMLNYNIKVPKATEFVGFENYARILTSAHWWTTVKTTVVFTVTSVGIEFVIGLLLALIMNRSLGNMTGIVRMAILLPWATITVVTALAWKWVFTPDLTLNLLQSMFGIVAEEGCMLCGRYTAMGAMVFADVWKTAPFIALLLLAGLQSIDAEQYEAADVDGASTWTKFRAITLPALKPAILVALLFRTLDSFRMFDLAYVMTGGANETETVSMLAYSHLIGRLNMGLGSAMSVLIFAMVFAIAVFFTKVLGANPRGEEGAH